jgi:uncharacterized protein (TIGR02444 family)
MDAAARLWRWCGEVYRRTGVSDACLALQDDCGADVNLLLTLVWAGGEGIAVDAPTLARLREVSTAWQTQIVAPLRSVRRALKGRAEAVALREQVKAVELESERLEQALLVLALPPAARGGAPALALAAENLRPYLLNMTPINAAIPAARSVLRAAFPDGRADDIAAALGP